MFGWNCLDVEHVSRDAALDILTKDRIRECDQRFRRREDPHHHRHSRGRPLFRRRRLVGAALEYPLNDRRVSTRSHQWLSAALSRWVGFIALEHSPVLQDRALCRCDDRTEPGGGGSFGL